MNRYPVRRYTFSSLLGAIPCLIGDYVWFFVVFHIGMILITFGPPHLLIERGLMPVRSHEILCANFNSNSAQRFAHPLLCPDQYPFDVSQP